MRLNVWVLFIVLFIIPTGSFSQTAQSSKSPEGYELLGEWTCESTGDFLTFNSNQRLMYDVFTTPRLAHYEIDYSSRPYQVKFQYGAVAKRMISEVGTNGDAILAELIRNDVVEDVSNTEMGLKPNLDQKENIV